MTLEQAIAELRRLQGQQEVMEIALEAKTVRGDALRVLLDRLEAATEAIDLVDTPYPLEVFPERTDEQRDAIFAAMRSVDKYATEWFYAHVARERGRVARDYFLAARSPSRCEQP